MKESYDRGRGRGREQRVITELMKRKWEGMTGRGMKDGKVGGERGKVLREGNKKRKGVRSNARELKTEEKEMRRNIRKGNERGEVE